MNCVFPVLFAGSEIPMEKRILMLVVFGIVGIFSTVCLFAPRQLLIKFSGFIGTQNPLVARIVCLMGALLGWAIVAAVIATFAGMLS